MFFDHNDSALILSAVNSVHMGNNGWAELHGFPDRLIPALEAAGIVVIRGPALVTGRPVLKGFTAQAQAALKVAPYGESTYKPVRQRVEGPDYEGAILARDEARFLVDE